MTNGEKIKEIFPDAEISIVKSNYGRTKVAVEWKFEQIPSYYNLFYEDWWNAEYKEPTKHETKYCDRNICLKNEYNNIGCEDCEVTKSQESTTKNDIAVEEHKGEVMDFPNTFDEFAKDYGFRDKKEVYTNGSELIQVYRVKQWLEHINETTAMIDKSNFSQEQYKADLQSAYDCGYNQACKDKITMPYATPDNCENYIEQTIKNDLAVDCIDRNSIKYYPGTGGYMYASKGEIDKLPSVIPQKPILDKIRAEIEQLSTTTCTETRRIYIDADDFKENVLAILDKYRGETEEA